MSEKTIPPEVPPTATLVAKNEAGKKITINTCGGALKNVKGTILYGPFIFVFGAQSTHGSDGKKFKDGKLRPVKFTTEPYWCVHVHGYNLNLNLAENEFTMDR